MILSLLHRDESTSSGCFTTRRKGIRKIAGKIAENLRKIADCPLTNPLPGAGPKMLSRPQPEPDLFSYAALSREDEAAAREDAALIRTNSEDIARKGIEIGRALNRQSVKMPHGMWLAYLRDECRLSERSAQVLMKAARDMEANPHLGAYLDGGSISIKAIDLMFARSTPTEVRDRVESLLVDGQKVTVADIRRMKAERIDHRSGE